jgi:hypothetical protein
MTVEDEDASDTSAESKLASARTRSLIAWVTLAWMLLCAGHSWGLLWLVPTLADCSLAGWHPAAAPLAALCSIGAMGFAALSGVLAHANVAGMDPRALRVPITLIAFMAIFFVLPAVVWAVAWSIADTADMARVCVLFGSAVVPQLAAALSLKAAYSWSPRAESKKLAALWPLAAWSGCVVTYVAVMAAVQIPHCLSLL